MAERYIPEHRRTQFKAKNTFKPEELRRRREEQQVEIRKAKREENLAKRRGIGGTDGSSRPGASLGAEADSDDDTVPTESQVSRSRTFTFPLLRILAALRDQWSRLAMEAPHLPFVYFCLVGSRLATGDFRLCALTHHQLHSWMNHKWSNQNHFMELVLWFDQHAHICLCNS